MTKLTISRAARLLQTLQISPTELSLYCFNLASFGEYVLQIHAFSHLHSIYSILQQAKASEARIISGKPLSILDGIPISIKANIAVQGLPFTASSRILGASSSSSSIQDLQEMKTLWLKQSNDHNNTQSKEEFDTNICGYDSYVAKQLLRKNGAVLMGLTNMDEFGMGSLGTNINGDYGFTKNPKPYLDFISSRFEKEDSDPTMYPFFSQRYGSTKQDENLLDDIWAKRIRNFAHLNYWKESPLLHENYTHVPVISSGGSSCGSAASVAMGSSLTSIGTDTGGSVRLPAAWCGIIGVKPSYGLISRHGVISYASSLDTVGVLSPTVTCASIVLDHLIHKVDTKEPSNAAKIDTIRDQCRDATAVCVPSTTRLSDSLTSQQLPYVHSSSHSDHASLKNVTVGIPSAFSIEECPSHIQQSWKEAADTLLLCGANLKVISSQVISPEIIKQSLPAYYILACAEASSNLARYDGLRYGPKYHKFESFNTISDSASKTSIFDPMSPMEQTYAGYRATHFGHEVTRRILCGTAVLSTDRYNSYYQMASYIRSTLKKQFRKALESVDCILIPTAMSDPPPLGQIQKSDRNIEVFANDVLTVPSSLCGWPTISIPLITKSREKPIGFQIMGPKFSEHLILRTAHSLLEANKNNDF